MIRQPPKIGAIRFHHEPESSNTSHADVTATTLQGTTSVISSRGPYQLEGARWHLLTKVFSKPDHSISISTQRYSYRDVWMRIQRIDLSHGRFFARLPNFLELQPTLARLVSRPLPSFPMHEEERRLRGGHSLTVQWRLIRARQVLQVCRPCRPGLVRKDFWYYLEYLAGWGELRKR